MLSVIIKRHVHAHAYDVIKFNLHIRYLYIRVVFVRQHRPSERRCFHRSAVEYDEGEQPSSIGGALLYPAGIQSQSHLAHNSPFLLQCRAGSSLRFHSGWITFPRRPFSAATILYLFLRAPSLPKRKCFVNFPPGIKQDIRIIQL